MNCPKCDAANREGVKFCEECGATMEVECPNCKAKVPPGKKFCGECGLDLRKPAKAKPLDYDQPHSYTPKHLADKILTNRSSIEGERKLVTILFADVANSTAMFENLDPEAVHEIMDGCFRLMMDEIHRYEGTINQFRGDGVMALFGAPIAHEDHAQRACHAALAVQKALIPYSEILKGRYGIDFKMRIGLNSGPVVVGSIGDDLRMDYTAQGDTANLAARMESSAEAGSVLVSDNTYRLVREFFEVNPLGGLQVKGKQAPVEAYRLIKPTEVETRIAASVAKGLTRFVGRQREIETLKEAFDKVQSGEGQVVGVVGEAGVGKSRLLLEFRNKLPKGEHFYFEGRCLHYGGSMPYLPILDVTRSFIGVKEGEQEQVIRQKLRERILGLDENLAHVIPPYQELLSLTVDDEEFAKLEPKQKREKTFEAIRDLLIRGSQDRPLVLVVEDLHWIDKTTEEFLGYMIGWLPKTRILLLLLYRPEYTHQWGSKSYYCLITLGQLSTSTSAELVAAILEGGDVVPELRDLILNRAAGNPLFMEELTHSLLQNGSIQKKGESFVLARDVNSDQVPDTIQGIIAARMDRLEESLKRIMQVAAVIGREFAFRILETITEMKEELKSGLVNLQGLEFIYEKSLFPDLEYIFRHALVQEVAYNSLLVNRRKEIHEKIGKAIEGLYSTRLDEFCEMLAYHYSKSGNLEKAYLYLKLAGEKATRNYSLREAFRAYRTAVDIVAGMKETDENRRRKLELILRISIVSRTLAYPEDCLAVLQDGEKLALELNDFKTATQIQSLLGTYYATVGGDPVKGREYMNRALQHASEVEDVGLLATCGHDLCTSYQVQGDYATIVDMAPNIIAMLENTRTEHESFGRVANLYSWLLAQYGLSLGGVGEFEEGIRVCERALAFADEINEPISRCVTELYYACLYFFRGDGEETVRRFSNSAACVEKLQIRIFLGLVWTWLGSGHHLLGNSGIALEYMEKGLKIQNDVGIQFWLSSHYYLLSLVHFDLGNLEKARAFAQEAVTLGERSDAKLWHGLSLISLGRTIGAINPVNADLAQGHFEHGIGLLQHMKLRPDYSLGYLWRGELYTRLGRRDQASQDLRRAESMFHEMGMDYWLGKAQEALANLQG